MNSTRVVYIIGSGRTGSTILGQVLNSTEGVFFGGEMIDFWVRGVVENRLCSCRERAHDCPIWGPVIERILDRVPEAELRRFVRARSGIHAQERWTRGALSLIAREKFRYSPEALANLEFLYQTLSETTGSALIVDSSKFAYYARALEAIPGINLSLLHLVRDPRAVAHSWKRRKIIPDPDEYLLIPQFGTIGSTLRWIFRNVAARSMSTRMKQRYSLVRYEDFIRDPQKVLDRLAEELGIRSDRFTFRYPPGESLPTNHAIWGNPTRFEAGRIKLIADDDWRTSQRSSEKLIVSAMTAPWLSRFGYSGSSGESLSSTH